MYTAGIGLLLKLDVNHSVLSSRFWWISGGVFHYILYLITELTNGILLYHQILNKPQRYLRWSLFYILHSAMSTSYSFSAAGWLFSYHLFWPCEVCSYWFSSWAWPTATLIVVRYRLRKSAVNQLNDQILSPLLSSNRITSWLIVLFLLLKAHNTSRMLCQSGREASCHQPGLNLWLIVTDVMLYCSAVLMSTNRMCYLRKLRLVKLANNHWTRATSNQHRHVDNNLQGFWRLVVLALPALVTLSKPGEFVTTEPM